ncbi:MAG TPA: TetR/AcrR family transcriptional regulator [Acidimicrobiales bacterium]|nr:TetR/AcrR family transcriptional regulator [Acidimicrobiales bacterium]
MKPAPKAGPRTRPGREEKKAATRDALIEAATKVFARQGYVAASVDDVAWEAGLTKGAVYSNFASKDALFEAVIERADDRRMREILERVDWSAPASEQAAWAGQQFMAMNDPDLFLLMLDYTLHAARFPAGNESMRSGHRRLKAAVGKTMERMGAELNWDVQAALPIPELVTAFFAMADGVALEQLYDPDGCPEDLYAKMLTIFVRGLVAISEDPSGASPPSVAAPSPS